MHKDHENDGWSNHQAEPDESADHVSNAFAGGFDVGVAQVSRQRKQPDKQEKAT